MMQVPFGIRSCPIPRAQSSLRVVISGSKLAPGLNVAATGGISGKPTAKAADSFTVKASDTNTQSNPTAQITTTKRLSITVAQ